MKDPTLQEQIFAVEDNYHDALRDNLPDYASRLEAVLEDLRSKEREIKAEGEPRAYPPTKSPAQSQADAADLAAEFGNIYPEVHRVVSTGIDKLEELLATVDDLRSQDADTVEVDDIDNLIEALTYFTTDLNLVIDDIVDALDK